MTRSGLIEKLAEAAELTLKAAELAVIVVQDLLGHSSLTTTTIYLRLLARSREHLAGPASFILSGDRHLKALERFEDIYIVARNCQI